MKKVIIMLLIPFCLVFGSEKTSMAVYEFDANDVSKEMAGSVADFVQDGLQSTGRFNLIERKKVEQVLREQMFQKSGCTSTDCAVEVGRILNVTHIIVGSVSHLSKKYVISIKLVDVEASKISLTDEIECDSEDSFNTAAKMLAEHFSKGVSVVGKVLKVMEDNDIIVNIGTEDGIDSGMVLDVIRLGQSVKDDSDKVVYQDKKKIAKIKITEPMEEASKATIVEPYNSEKVELGDVVELKPEKLSPLAAIITGNAQAEAPTPTSTSGVTVIKRIITPPLAVAQPLTKEITLIGVGSPEPVRGLEEGAARKMSSFVSAILNCLCDLANKTNAEKREGVIGRKLTILGDVILTDGVNFSYKKIIENGIELNSSSSLYVSKELYGSKLIIETEKDVLRSPRLRDISLERLLKILALTSVKVKNREFTRDGSCVLTMTATVNNVTVKK